MYKSLIKITIRKLLRTKSYILLNVFGLAIGLTSVIFITTWSLNEFSYDRFYPKHKRIYRLVDKVTSNSETYKEAVTPIPIANLIVQNYSEVENSVRLDMNDCIVKYGSKQFEEDGILFADQSIFNVFDIKLTKGNITKALVKPYSIVVTKSIAHKYFGNDDPIGKSMILFKFDPDGQGAAYQITGVIPDPPQNSHFTYNIIASFGTYEAVVPNINDQWFDNAYTYLLLRKSTNPKKLEKKLPDLITNYTTDVFKRENASYDYLLQPITDIHLYSDLRSEIQTNGSIQTVYIFVTLGLFILLIACINYINLSTAYSIKRAKEVGVKKLLGVGKFHLIFQFLIESIIIIALSLIIAIIFFEFLKPYFFTWTGQQLSQISSPYYFLLFLCTAVVLGVISGIYPAFILSNFEITNTLKGRYFSSQNGISIRKFLVVLQFTISGALIVGIIIVKSQINFIQNKNLGFKKESLLTIKVNGFSKIQNEISSFKNKLISNSNIPGVSVSHGLIGSGLDSREIECTDGANRPISTSIFYYQTDPDFLKVYKIKLLAGHNFYSTDSQNVYLVNESTVRKFGWKDDANAIDKTVIVEGRKGKIIGVVKDFNFAPLKTKIAPLIIGLTAPNIFSNITVRFNTKNTYQIVNHVKSTYTEYFPGALFSYSFMDQKLTDIYKHEKLFNNIFMFFVILSLVIACMGLIGLTAFSVEQHTKEIGIRKVLGSSVTNIFVRFSKEYIKPVFLASLISYPISYYLMNKWLENFAYRINIHWWIFFLSSGILLIIASITISFQAIKAALANPVKSLKYE